MSSIAGSGRCVKVGIGEVTEEVDRFYKRRGTLREKGSQGTKNSEESEITREGPRGRFLNPESLGVRGDGRRT